MYVFFLYRQVLEVNQGECLSEERAWDYFIDLLLGVEYRMISVDPVAKL